MLRVQWGMWCGDCLPQTWRVLCERSAEKNGTWDKGECVLVQTQPSGRLLLFDVFSFLSFFLFI